MPTVRVQGPGPAVTMSFEDGATLDDLRQRIASELAIPASVQELRAGFPPQVLGAAGSALISSELGGSARVLVKSFGAGAKISGCGGGSSSSQAGGRKKAPVQRVEGSANPRDVQARAEAAAEAAAAQRSAATQEAEVDTTLPAKRARAQARFLTPEESAAELLGEDAPAPRKRADKPSVKPAAPLAAEPAGAAAASAAPPAASKASGRVPKPKTPEQIASAYFLGASSMQPGRAGTTAHLTDLGTIEHRVGAVRARQYELVQVGAAQLQATFKATRKQVCETVQLLREVEIRAVLAALASRGSSSRGRANNHLLSVREMASRSPALLWSLVLAYDGDVEAGVRELQG